MSHDFVRGQSVAEKTGTGAEWDIALIYQLLYFELYTS